jgi:hypothetical protein
MPLNSSGKLSLGGSTVGESVDLELGLSATATNSMVSDANKLLTLKSSGPWVFPDDWRGKSRANEAVTGTTLTEINGPISYTITGGVPNSTFTYTGGVAGGGPYTLNAFGNYYGNETAVGTIGSHSLIFTFASTGHSRTYAYTAYNESVTATSYSVSINTPINIYLTGGVPNSDFSFSGAASGQSSLDGGGFYTFAGVSYATSGTYSYTVLFLATGALRTISIVVLSPLAITGPTSLSNSVNQNIQSWDNYVAVGGAGTYTWQVTGTLPSGVGLYTLNGDTSRYYYLGVVTQSGTFTVSVTAYDINNNASNTITTTISIQAPAAPPPSCPPPGVNYFPPCPPPIYFPPCPPACPGFPPCPPPCPPSPS